jgi:putative transposase
VFSRKALIYMLKFNIQKEDVMMLLSLLILEYRIAGFTICNDNVSLFIATMDREFLIEKGVIQEFTPVATPEENSYLRSFHSIIQREVVDRFEFESFDHAKRFFTGILNGITTNGSIVHSAGYFQKSFRKIGHKNIRAL